MFLGPENLADRGHATARRSDAIGPWGFANAGGPFPACFWLSHFALHYFLLSLRSRLSRLKIVSWSARVLVVKPAGNGLVNVGAR